MMTMIFNEYPNIIHHDSSVNHNSLRIITALHGTKLSSAVALLNKIIVQLLNRMSLKYSDINHYGPLGNHKTQGMILAILEA